MLFHMVWSILFGVLGQETTFSLFEVLQQPIKNFHFKVFRANMRRKMDHIMWKSMKNWAQKWCRSLCAFLFEATCAFGKMCLYEPCERPPWQNFHGSSTYIRDERRIELNKNIYFCLAMTLGVKLLSNLLNFRAKRRLSLPISGFVSRKSSLTCDDKSEAKKEQVTTQDDKCSKEW